MAGQLQLFAPPNGQDNMEMERDMMRRTLILRCLQIRHPLLRPGTPTILGDVGIADGNGDLAAEEL